MSRFIDIYTLQILLLVVLFAPLVGALVAGAFGMRDKLTFVGWFNSFCILCAFLASAVLVIVAMEGITFGVSLFDWIEMGGFSVDFGFRLDAINAVMIVMISFVSLLVHLYSIGYMEHDKGFNRYFSFLSGFVFAMMFLVLSDNFLGLFIGWEGVGVCSYLLIGFWYERQSANFASMEAFISNRIADLGMLLGICLIFWVFGTLNFEQVFAMLDTPHAAQNFAESTFAFAQMENPNSLNVGAGAGINTSADISASYPWILSLIGILLFIGAMGKSAQFPLHTWLANAMEGPTPVSALIHAATMVTAGVYLVIRAHPLYMQIPHIGEFIAYLGAFVAIFAASMALVGKDLKRIIAYSTLSQLGYMFVAAGLGAYWVALFHLFTHAFFKSLLFLSAGNVMHAMHDGLDITRMGRLAKPLKYTMIFMLIGNLALCGIPPFAGYFSKDLILEFSFSSDYKILWGILVFGAFLSAFYSFRMFMLVFFAPKSSDAYDIPHPHEASKLMLFAMFPLAVLALIAGVFHDKIFFALNKILAFEMPHGLLDEHTLAGIALGASSAGILYAWARYRSFDYKPAGNFFYRLLANQYYIPQIYHAVFVRFFGAFCVLLWQKVEKAIFDKSIDAVGVVLLWLSKMLGKCQNGNISTYLRVILFGVLVLLLSVFALVLGGK